MTNPLFSRAKGTNCLVVQEPKMQGTPAWLWSMKIWNLWGARVIECAIQRCGECRLALAYFCPAARHTYQKTRLSGGSREMPLVKWSTRLSLLSLVYHSKVVVKWWLCKRANTRGKNKAKAKESVCEVVFISTEFSQITPLLSLVLSTNEKVLLVTLSLTILCSALF